MISMIALSVFLTTFLLVVGVGTLIFSLINSEKVVVKNRMEAYQKSSLNPTLDQQLALLKRESEWEQDSIFSTFPPLLNLPLLFVQAGIREDVKSWLLKKIAISAVVAIVCLFFLKSFLLAIVALMGTFLVCYLNVLLTRQKRIDAFEANLAQALEIISRSLRAGHPFSMGIKLVSTELPTPMKEEFSQVFYEQQMGIPLEESLKRMVKRVPLLDLRFFVITIMIHSQTGGDLAEILDNLSKVIRERFKILGQVRALTAEGRLSGWVLGVLPFFVVGILLSVNPSYINILLENPLGIKMIYGALVMQSLGILVIRKIVNIKVLLWDS